MPACGDETDTPRSLQPALSCSVQHLSQQTAGEDDFVPLPATFQGPEEKSLSLAAAQDQHYLNGKWDTYPISASLSLSGPLLPLPATLGISISHLAHHPYGEQFLQ